MSGEPLEDYYARWHDTIERQLSSAVDVAIQERSPDPLSRVVEELMVMRTQSSATAAMFHSDSEHGTATDSQFAKAQRQAAELQSELERTKTRVEALDAELQALKLQKRGANAAWDPFDAVLKAAGQTWVSSSNPTSAMEGKMIAQPEFMFGSPTDFLQGLSGLMGGSALTRSMEMEFRENDGGRWFGEYDYIVHRQAEEDVDAHGGKLFQTTRIHHGKISLTGERIVRDRGHGGMGLTDFHAHPNSIRAGLSLAEVAALRLYSGPAFAPINAALRSRTIREWATTIACCYSGVLKLSLLSKPARVYRGVCENDHVLPRAFLSADDEFAGGIELAFMSTTRSPAVALDYSGGAAATGTLFAIDFDLTSRGASIGFLSQYPHEEELLFPPFTGLSCSDVSARGVKKLALISVQVSTARPDTSEFETPQSMPRLMQAQETVARALTEEALKRHHSHRKRHHRHSTRALQDSDSEEDTAPDARRYSPTDALEMQEWHMNGAEAALAAVLLIRANKAVRLRVLNLGVCDVTAETAKDLACALTSNTTIEILRLSSNRIGPAGAEALADALMRNRTVREIYLCTNGVGEGAVAFVPVIESNMQLVELDLDQNGISSQSQAILDTANKHRKRPLRLRTTTHNMDRELRRS